MSPCVGDTREDEWISSHVQNWTTIFIVHWLIYWLIRLEVLWEEEDLSSDFSNLRVMTSTLSLSNARMSRIFPIIKTFAFLYEMTRPTVRIMISMRERHTREKRTMRVVFRRLDVSFEALDLYLSSDLKINELAFQIPDLVIDVVWCRPNDSSVLAFYCFFSVLDDRGILFCSRSLYTEWVWGRNVRWLVQVCNIQHHSLGKQLQRRCLPQRDFDRQSRRNHWQSI